MTRVTVLFFSYYSPPICQDPMLIIGREKSVPNLAIELGTVWILKLLLKGASQLECETPSAGHETEVSTWVF